MKEILDHQLNYTRRMDDEYRPSFYRMNRQGDVTALESLFAENPQIRVKDEIESQLVELAKLRFPKEKLSPEQTKERIDEILGGAPRKEYGVWVYYPWQNTLVHTLDESEFKEVKTNRNQHKITRQQNLTLGEQSVGVVGLSVGRTISITMTMEGSYGEIRLADFDILELSNYNRIRAGLNDLGLKKTISVAREIAELDPFVKVTCFNDGLNEDNIHDFFTKGGQLNAVVDECDGLDVKILLREKAKELGVPVIMELNDRGTLDVERFDLEPDRPLLHGYIGHLDSKKLKGLTNEQKIPFIMPMLGEDTISTKLKASMLEIEQTLSTWPQLATDVMLGGAIAANVYRRIILGEFTDSGRYFVDMNDLVKNEGDPGFKRFEQEVVDHSNQLVQADLESIVERYDLNQIDGQIELAAPVVDDLVKAAIQAPSTANVQPWKWLYADKSLFLIHDPVIGESYGDYKQLGSLISYGAAIENLVHKAQELSLNVSVEYPKIKGEELEVVAQIRFLENSSDLEPVLKPNLAQHIYDRHTNRKRKVWSPLPEDVQSELIQTANSVDGTELKLFTDRNQLAEAAELIGIADQLRFFHEEGHYDFFVREARWSKEEAETTSDGIDMRTVELTAGELTGMRMARSFDVVKQMKEWGGGGAFKKMAVDAFSNCSALGLFCVKDLDVSPIEVGRSMERAWLKSTELKVSVQPWMSIIFHFNRLINGDGEGMDQEYIEQTKKLREQFRKLLSLDNELKDLFLVRFFYAEEPAVKSIRKPVEKVLSQKRN